MEQDINKWLEEKYKEENKILKTAEKFLSTGDGQATAELISERIASSPILIRNMGEYNLPSTEMLSSYMTEYIKLRSSPLFHKIDEEAIKAITSKSYEEPSVTNETLKQYIQMHVAEAVGTTIQINNALYQNIKEKGLPPQDMRNLSMIQNMDQEKQNNFGKKHDFTFSQIVMLNSLMQNSELQLTNRQIIGMQHYAICKNYEEQTAANSQHPGHDYGNKELVITDYNLLKQHLTETYHQGVVPVFNINMKNTGYNAEELNQSTTINLPLSYVEDQNPQLGVFRGTVKFFAEQDNCFIMMTNNGVLFTNDKDLIHSKGELESSKILDVDIDVVDKLWDSINYLALYKQNANDSLDDIQNYYNIQQSFQKKFEAYVYNQTIPVREQAVINLQNGSYGKYFSDYYQQTESMSIQIQQIETVGISRMEIDRDIAVGVMKQLENPDVYVPESVLYNMAQDGMDINEFLKSYFQEVYDGKIVNQWDMSEIQEQYENIVDDGLAQVDNTVYENLIDSQDQTYEFVK